jgi:hypothetical protein
LIGRGRAASGYRRADRWFLSGRHPKAEASPLNPRREIGRASPLSIPSIPDERIDDRDRIG